MKYTAEIIINAPLKEFISKMDDPDNMKHWQRGFESYEYTEGTPGEVGAQMKMYYSKPKMELLETIVKRELPHEFHATYDSNGVIILNKNYFSETADQKTKWISENEVSADKFFIKAMMFLMPGMFKKNTTRMMQDLKAFVEDGTSVQKSSGF